MKIYAVVVSDYDLYDEYGFYKSKEAAEKRLEELKNQKDFLWKKHLSIQEKELERT